MKRKVWLFISLVLLAGLFTTAFSPAQAGSEEQWIQVPFPAPDNTSIHALETFKENLYAAVEDFSQGLSIWRMVKDGQWDRVTEYGFGNADLSDVMDMIQFNGMLYASSGDYYMRTTGQMWRSADGNNWEAVTVDAFGKAGLYNIGLFAIFQDQLYVDISAGSGSMEIWRSASGDPGTWEPVVTAAEFGDGFASAITGFTQFKGALYAAIETDWLHPVRLWRTVDGIHWTVVSDPVLMGPFNVSPGGMEVFKDYLYLGMLHCDFINSTACLGAQIYRSKDGLHWEAVISSSDDWKNIKVDSLFQFEGQLYAGIWNEDWVNYEYLPGSGVQIWRTSDGMNWTQINEGGFGDPNNWATHLSVDVAAYKGELYYGTLHIMSGQIWKLSKK